MHRYVRDFATSRVFQLGLLPVVTAAALAVWVTRPTDALDAIGDESLTDILIGVQQGLEDRHGTVCGVQTMSTWSLSRTAFSMKWGTAEPRPCSQRSSTTSRACSVRSVFASAFTHCSTSGLSQAYEMKTRMGSGIGQQAPSTIHMALGADV